MMDENKKKMNKTNVNQCKLGDLVYIKRRRMKKLEKFWDGPYQVIKISNGNSSAKIKLENKQKWINMRYLRKKKEERENVENVIKNEMINEFSTKITKDQSRTV